MFDIGFFELVLVGIVGLLVLGPERLPHAVRMGSAWIGKLRRSFMDIQRQIEQEVDAEDIRRLMQAELEKSGLNELKNELGTEVEQLKEQMVESIAHDESGIDQTSMDGTADRQSKSDLATMTANKQTPASNTDSVDLDLNQEKPAQK